MSCQVAHVAQSAQLAELSTNNNSADMHGEQIKQILSHYPSFFQRLADEIQT